MRASRHTRRQLNGLDRQHRAAVARSEKLVQDLAKIAHLDVFLRELLEAETVGVTPAGRLAGYLFVARGLIVERLRSAKITTSSSIEPRITAVLADLERARRQRLAALAIAERERARLICRGAAIGAEFAANTVSNLVSSRS
jgi:hypothetical protein